MAKDITLNQLAKQLKTTKNRVKYYARMLDSTKCYKDSNGVVLVTPDGAQAIADKIANREAHKAVYEPIEPLEPQFNGLERLKTTTTDKTAINRANNRYTTPENHKPAISTPENSGAGNLSEGATPATDADIIAVLRAQLEAKDKQIESLTDALQRTQEALEREQAALEREQVMHAAAAIEAPQKKKGLLASIFHKKSAGGE